MWIIFEFMIFQVQYCYSILPRLHKYGLFLVEHPHRIHRVLEISLKYYFSFGVDMDHTIPSIRYQREKHKSIVEGSMKIQYFFVFLDELDLIGFVQYHQMKEDSYQLLNRRGSEFSFKWFIKEYTLCLLFWLLQLQFMSDFDYLLKFIVVGDTGVGKSCVVNQFIEQQISDNHEITLGVEFASRNLTVANKNIKLQVWDTAGQENFRSITRSYYRSAVGALLIYDITRKKSFEHLQDWIKEIKNNGSDQIQILVIGNKNDLENQREVTSDGGRNFAQQNQLQWIEITAKQYTKVEAAFRKLASSIISRIGRGEINESTPGVKLGHSDKIDPLADYGSKKKYCC